MRYFSLLGVLLLTGCVSTYTVETTPIAKTNGYSVVRLNTRTGECWWGEGNKWRKIKDAAPIPASRYELRLTPISDDFAAVRFDPRNGRTWYADSGRWFEMTD